ncbi:MAG TPA: heavy metal-associated domain-containing protein [Longimicrobiales bacterium]|nr:heavy metal-associated domain-containing protein [Longimicrobiales bacterium]
MPTLKLHVAMEHPDDEARVERLLRAQAGVYGAVANRGKACVEVDFEDDEETVQHLVETLAAAGYEARLAG